MPKISIMISDYTYWKLLGCGDNVSYIIQKALHDYWKENQASKKNNNITSTLVQSKE